MRIPLTSHAYELESKPLSAQRLVNMYYEPASEETKTKEAVYDTGGLDLFATVGDGPIWGIHPMGSLLYVVSGSNVYKINDATSGTLLGSIGTVADDVIMSDDGNDVIIVKEDGAAYLADSSSLTQITDGDFPSVSSVTVLDTYSIFTKKDTTQYIISALNDASAYDAADIASAEESPDLLVRAFANHGQLWLFGQRTTEVHNFTDSGDFPYAPQANATMQRGCGAKRSVAQEDNTLFWLGDDRIVYRADGYSPVRISTHAIEKAIQDYTTISDAVAFVYTQNGHKFYTLTFPTELVTWVYDIATGKWSQRQSFEKGRWRASGFAFQFNKNLVGDFENGNIYEINPNSYTENGATIQRIITLPNVFNDTKRIVFSNFIADFDAGLGLVSGQGSDPQVMMRYSNDGGYTWSNGLWGSMGQIGEYSQRTAWYRLGIGRQRVFELTVSDPIPVHLTGAYINEND